MPDANPNFTGSPRINGGWGKGVTAATLGSVHYINGSLAGTVGGGQGSTSTNFIPCGSTTGPFCDSGAYMIGDLGRVAPYGLRGPSVYRLTSAVTRTFDITDRTKFIFRVDCQNVTNTVTFGNNASNNQIGLNVDTA